jgi:hypothetical protein
VLSFFSKQSRSRTQFQCAMMGFCWIVGCDGSSVSKDRRRCYQFILLLGLRPPPVNERVLPLLPAIVIHRECDILTPKLFSMDLRLLSVSANF